MAREHSPDWLILTAPAASELIIERSRFLTALLPLDAPEAAAVEIAAIRKREVGARHHCSALIVGPGGQVQRSNDDGEPAGTAGQPMLEVLRRRQVTGILAVVTRYFGGILLGAGGLVRAYSGAVATALDGAALARLEPRIEYAVVMTPAQAGRGENALRVWAKANQARIEVAYGAEVIARVTIRPDQATDFAAYTATRGLTAVPGPASMASVPV